MQIDLIKENTDLIREIDGAALDFVLPRLTAHFKKVNAHEASRPASNDVAYDILDGSRDTFLDAMDAIVEASDPEIENQLARESSDICRAFVQAGGTDDQYHRLYAVMGNTSHQPQADTPPRQANG